MPVNIQNIVKVLKWKLENQQEINVHDELFVGLFLNEFHIIMKLQINTFFID